MTAVLIGGAEPGAVTEERTGAPEESPATETPHGGAEGRIASASTPGVPDRPTVIENELGGAGLRRAFEPACGAPSRFVDESTQMLGALAATRQDFQQTRKAAAQRVLSDKLVESLRKVEEQLAAALSKELRRHPLWPWLSQFPGLGGVHTARLISRIGDPRRFPGQPCTIGHILVPRYDVGDPCPIGDRDGVACPGVMLAPRPHTGTRAVWHYCGVHVDDEGRSPRKRKGARVTWDTIARTALLQPDGIADAIVRNRVPVYRDIYDAQKARLALTRGAVSIAEAVGPSGPAVYAGVNDPVPGGADHPGAFECDAGPALRPFEVDRLARKIAVKAFLGDLLAEWKRVVAVRLGEGESRTGDGTE